jgi:hypothetical protein
MACLTVFDQSSEMACMAGFAGWLLARRVGWLLAGLVGWLG